MEKPKSKILNFFLLKERFRDGLRLLVEAKQQKKKKKRSTRRVLERQALLDKPSGVITWHSVIKAEVPRLTPPELGILAGQH